MRSFSGNGPLRSVFLLPLRGRTGSQCSRTRFGRFFTFNPNFKQMENIQTKQYPCFKRWSRKNWSIFASLHRYVTIGVLSVGMSILLLATQGASAQTADTTAVLKTLRIREVGVTGSQTAPARNAQSHTPLFDRKAPGPGACPDSGSRPAPCSFGRCPRTRRQGNAGRHLHPGRLFRPDHGPSQRH